MSAHPTTLALALVLAAALAAAEPPPRGAAKEPSAEVTKPMTLTDAKVKGFLDAMDELKQSGAVKPASARNAKTFAGALDVPDEAEEVLKKHGFAGRTEFRRVGYNAALAYAVARQGGKAAVAKRLESAENAKATGFMAAFGQHLSPEQQKKVEAQLAARAEQDRALRDVPEANVALIQKYRARMDALGRR